jgi:hypothetical protein
MIFSRVAYRLGSDGADATQGVAGFFHEVFCETAFNNDVKDAGPGLFFKTKVVRDWHASIMISLRFVGPIVLPVGIRISSYNTDFLAWQPQRRMPPASSKLLFFIRSIRNLKGVHDVRRWPHAPVKLVDCGVVSFTGSMVVRSFECLQGDNPPVQGRGLTLHSLSISRISCLVYTTQMYRASQFQVPRPVYMTQI